MSIKSSKSFLQRLEDPARRAETLRLAEYIGNELVPEGARLFLVSGTTTYKTADLLLQKVQAVHIQTNSVPVAWRFMELVEAAKAKPHATVAVMGGEVRARTGAVACKMRRGSNAAVTLLFAPHGLTEKGLEGDRDVDEIKSLLDAHARVIMPVSWTKLWNAGERSIKHWGHWKPEWCKLVITAEPDPGLNLPTEAVTRGRELLAHIKKMMGDALEIIKVPL